MAAQRLLLKTNVSGFQPVTLFGQPITASYERLAGFLENRLPGQLQPFAEPLESGTTITWYGEGTNQPIALTELPPTQRSIADKQLTRVLASLDPFLDDPDVGALLRRALVLPSLDGVVALDDGIVFTNWGYAPTSVGADTEALTQHLRQLFGPYSLRLAAIDGSFFESGAADPAPPPASAAMHAVTQVMPRAQKPPAPSPRLPEGGAPPPNAAATRAGLWNTRYVWAIPVVTAVAAIFLALGYWLAWMHFVSDLAGRQFNAPAMDQAKARMAIQVQRQTNEALERDVARARQALASPDVCTPEAPGGLTPSPDRQPIQPGAVPEPVPQQQGQPAAPFSGSLADLLEHATVWVVSTTPTGISSGSGFFISGDSILTNAHVVANADPDNVFVTSKALGRVLKGRVVASTATTNSDGIRAGTSDFAVIQLAEAAAGAQPLALSEMADKLTDVVAAGYPNSIVKHEEAVQALRQGRLTGAPELVLTRGSISSVQRLPNDLTILPHSADISSGNSGGPLVNMCGSVLGINTFVTAGDRFVDRTKYALKVDSVLPWLRQHRIAVRTTSEDCRPMAASLPASPVPASPTPVGTK